MDPNYEAPVENLDDVVAMNKTIQIMYWTSQKRGYSQSRNAVGE